jgi:signal transduction histidine kinase
VAELGELPGAVLVTDAAGVVLDANAAAEVLVGRPLVGVALRELIDGFTTWPRAAALRSVTGLPENEVTLRRGDGATIPVLVAACYRREGDALAGAVVTIRPTRRRGRHTPSGIEIVSTVSHELRAPLTSVKGYTSLLLNRWDRIDDEQKKLMLSQVHHDADRVTRLVTELLDISRLETGRLHLRRQLIDIPAISRSVVEKVGLEYEGLECVVEFGESFPRVYADPDKIEQVLTNLVENAAKYASPTQMRVEGRAIDGRVEVAVHDVGEGIPAADLPRVFTKFFRRDHGKPTGSGLGLWISRGLVEAHGGQLSATSKVGQGSVFAFTLPTDAFERLHET